MTRNADAIDYGEESADAIDHRRAPLAGASASLAVVVVRVSVVVVVAMVVVVFMIMVVVVVMVMAVVVRTLTGPIGGLSTARLPQVPAAA